eukprot:2885261-Rhodomonas_salina.2
MEGLREGFQVPNSCGTRTDCSQHREVGPAPGGAQADAWMRAAPWRTCEKGGRRAGQVHGSGARLDQGCSSLPSARLLGPLCSHTLSHRFLHLRPWF